jgi:hypothetical protein
MTLRWRKRGSNLRSPQEGTGSPAALIEIVSQPSQPTPKRTVGLLVRIGFAPAVSQANFRIASLTRPSRRFFAED